ncbi:NAD(P)-binding domain-containing protein [Nocardia miyunensis]|uniref:NAD(P)-binding domain-containing protein n=1 Tax=Nocardia miyunensis TaxID=282684 RepID=UPI0012F4DB33
MRVAIIGLGRMGHALAERLLDKGHDERVEPDLRPGSCARGARRQGHRLGG